VTKEVSLRDYVGILYGDTRNKSTDSRPDGTCTFKSHIVTLANFMLPLGQSVKAFRDLATAFPKVIPASI